MKIFFAIVLLCHVISAVFCDDEKQLQDLTKEGIFEKADMSFRQVPGSDQYIRKFNLVGAEIDTIGSWAFDIYSRQMEGDRYGPGISVSFYPNRLFSILKANRGPGKIESIVGEWMVKDGFLSVRLRARVTRQNDSPDLQRKYRVDYLDSGTYYAIFRIQEYRIAFVNKGPYLWDSIPESIRRYYEIRTDDKARYRILFDTLGTPPGEIREKTQGGDFLMNPVWQDNYVRALISFW